MSTPPPCRRDSRNPWPARRLCAVWADSVPVGGAGRVRATDWGINGYSIFRDREKRLAATRRSGPRRHAAHSATSPLYSHRPVHARKLRAPFGLLRNWEFSSSGKTSRWPTRGDQRRQLRASPSRPNTERRTYTQPERLHQTTGPHEVRAVPDGAITLRVRAITQLAPVSGTQGCYRFFDATPKKHRGDQQAAARRQHRQCLTPRSHDKSGEDFRYQPERGHPRGQTEPRGVPPPPQNRLVIRPVSARQTIRPDVRRLAVVAVENAHLRRRSTTTASLHVEFSHDSNSPSRREITEITCNKTKRPANRYADPY